MSPIFVVSAIIAAIGGIVVVIAAFTDAVFDEDVRAGRSPWW